MESSFNKKKNEPVHFSYGQISSYSKPWCNSKSSLITSTPKLVTCRTCLKKLGLFYDKLEVGMRIFDDSSKVGYVKILAVAEGYVMAKRKCCPPFVLSVRQFKKLFALK